ncbi:MAG TPA: class I SAM-dependent methyltransferase [Streptosporangiaceae bacterium]|nr:class I SAM-dependent methyltransferase [Streptosporangiaceae bacterium]
MQYATTASATDFVASDTVDAYWRFYQAVTRAQLIAWLPSGRRFLVDVSGPRGDGALLAARAGHSVLRVLDPEHAAHRATRRQPGLHTLIADTANLSFLPSGCADAVLAGDRALSTHLAAEDMIAEISRVLRPAGRVLACVDSLVLGMAVLADQHRWPHLADLPYAEVVLIPWPDGSITRCYGTDQLRELFGGAGLRVSWVRPLTVLSQSMVSRVLRQDPAAMPRLVRAELSAHTEEAKADEAFGVQLVVCAYKGLAVKRLPAASLLGLAADAARGVRACLQPPLRYLVAAVHTPPVPALLDPQQCGEHHVALALRGVQDRLGPVVLGQDRAGVGRVLLHHRGSPRLWPFQVRNRPVQFLAHFLQALTGGADVHSTLQEFASRGQRPDQLWTVVPHEIDIR